MVLVLIFIYLYCMNILETIYEDPISVIIYTRSQTSATAARMQVWYFIDFNLNDSLGLDLALM